MGLIFVLSSAGSCWKFLEGFGEIALYSMSSSIRGNPYSSLRFRRPRKDSNIHWDFKKSLLPHPMRPFAPSSPKPLIPWALGQDSACSPSWVRQALPGVPGWNLLADPSPNSFCPTLQEHSGASNNGCATAAHRPSFPPLSAAFSLIYEASKWWEGEGHVKDTGGPQPSLLWFSPAPALAALSLSPGKAILELLSFSDKSTTCAALHLLLFLT